MFNNVASNIHLIDGTGRKNALPLYVSVFKKIPKYTANIRIKANKKISEEIENFILSLGFSFEFVEFDYGIKPISKDSDITSVNLSCKFMFLVSKKHKLMIHYSGYWGIIDDGDATVTDGWAILGEKENEVAQKILAFLQEKHINHQTIPTKRIRYVIRNANGFALNEAALPERDENDKLEFSDYYNDEFTEIDKHIIASLQKKNSKGLVLLHGGVGTGKSSYLRYLIRILDKQIIYITPNMANMMAAPEFMEFLPTLKNSVLVIEDAENILKNREGGENQAVSNILNASDGLLGDILNISFVCTFNCDKSEIDPALLRPGRLIAEYRFGNLSEEKTTNLVSKLYGEDETPKKPSMTLAEIFNMNKPEMISEPEIKKRGIGFVH